MHEVSAHSCDGDQFEADLLDARLKFIAKVAYRDLEIKKGRMAWRKASGCNWRALVEATISRYKRIIGPGLR
jgi:hypothetical protein